MTAVPNDTIDAFPQGHAHGKQCRTTVKIALRFFVVFGLIGVASVLTALVFSWMAPRFQKPPVLAPDHSAAGSLRFLAIGRQGYGNKMSRRLAAGMESAAAEMPTHGVLYLGDNFYPAGVTSLHDSQWQSKFEELYKGRHLRAMPFFVVLGNHDHDGDASVQVRYGRERLGSARWQMDAPYYTRDFGYAHGRVLMRVVFLDTVMMQKNLQPQLLFIQQAFAVPGNPIWRVIAGHHSSRSLTREPFTQQHILSDLLPHLQSLKVDLQVSADDRFQQILDRPGEPMHLSTNGGSDRQEQIAPPEFPETDGAISQPGFAVIQADAAMLTVQLRDSSGELSLQCSRLR